MQFLNLQPVCEIKYAYLTYMQLFATLWTIAWQAALSMVFSRHEYWSGLPCPSPGDLPDPGIEPTSLMSPALTGVFFTTSAIWEVLLLYSVQFNCSVMSNSATPWIAARQASLSITNSTPRVHSNSRPSSQWCHPTISSSVAPFSSCPQSLPASESFPMSQLFAWGGL